MLWALLNIVQCVLIRSRVLGALVLGRVIAGDGNAAFFAHDKGGYDAIYCAVLLSADAITGLCDICADEWWYSFP